MSVKNTVSSPRDTTARNADSLQVHIPSPHLLRDHPHRSLSLQATPSRRQNRPLPQPPSNSLAPSTRPALRRRATGGCFVDAAPGPPPPRTYGFYVCNPSDSPISPDEPQPPPYSRLAPEKLVAPPVNIVPATPLPPPTPGLNSRSHTNSSSPLHGRPDIHPPDPAGQSEKRRRRFGGSVGSVPFSVLEELRGMGEGNAPSRSVALSVGSAGTDSDSSSSEEDEEDVEDEEPAENYSWVVETATRGVRAKRRRSSSNWVQDLDKDRWAADRYSSTLRAL
ncbi:hypothetical protein B0H11DRAFT_2237054 [Mycena galericulata]|nr:hypothetical protein B0H11DRAFT_2237054 [Mycena galericulata]